MPSLREALTRAIETKMSRVVEETVTGFPLSPSLIKRTKPTKVETYGEYMRKTIISPWKYQGGQGSVDW